MRRGAIIAAVIAAAALSTAVPARVPSGVMAQESEPLATAVRGIAGTVEFEVAGERVTTRPVQTVTAPMVVRIVDSEPAGEGRTRYTAAFVGTIAGEYDLRELLQRHDGAPLEVDPIPVHVISQLPPDHGTDLFSQSEAPGLTASRYRAAMIALGVVWLAAPGVYFAVRAARRRPEPAAAPAPPPPTLAEQLRPLVESALAGELSVHGRGRLELLLYMHWRQRLGLSGPQAEAVARLRRDPEAGKLLRAVEAWLHARPGDAPADSDVTDLLAPYRDAPAIPEGEVSSRDNGVVHAAPAAAGGGQ